MTELRIGAVYTRAQCPHCERWGSMDIGENLSNTLMRIHEMTPIMLEMVGVLKALETSQPYQDEEKPYYMFSEEDAKRIRAALELAEKAGMGKL